MNIFCQGADQVTSICREMDSSSQPAEVPISAKSMSDAHKLRKVIMELIDTERMYVKVRIY